MKSHINTIYDHSTSSIGNSNNVFFWTDNWLDKAISEHWQIPHTLKASLTMHVAECIVNGAWCLLKFLTARDSVLASKILKITLPVSDVPDSLNWKLTTDGIMTSKSSYTFLASDGQNVPWFKNVWNSYTPPTRAFISRRFIHNRLPTDDNLRKRGCYVVSMCCFCNKAA